MPGPCVRAPAARREDVLAPDYKRSPSRARDGDDQAKLRDHLRSKTPTAMVNEVLCKIICHNICVLVQEAEVAGVEIN